MHMNNFFFFYFFFLSICLVHHLHEYVLFITYMNMSCSLEATVSVLFNILLSSLHFPLALEEHLNNYIFYIYQFFYLSKKNMNNLELTTFKGSTP